MTKDSSTCFIGSGTSDTYYFIPILWQGGSGLWYREGMSRRIYSFHRRFIVVLIDYPIHKISHFLILLYRLKLKLLRCQLTYWFYYTKKVKIHISGSKLMKNNLSSLRWLKGRPSNNITKHYKKRIGYSKVTFNKITTKKSFTLTIFECNRSNGVF